MDCGFFGLMDIIIILIILSSAYLGYKIGLLETGLKWLKRFVGLIAGVMYSFSLGNFINKHFLNEGKIHDFFYEKIYNKVSGVLADDATIDAAIDTLGFPGFIDNYIKSEVMTYNPESFVEQVTSRLTYAVGVVIAFLILTIGVYLIYYILLLVVKILKDSISIVDKIDKVLGCFIWIILGCIIVFVLLLIVTQIAKIDSLEGYRAFIYKDMCIGTDEWRLSKYINNHNFVRALFNIFFG